MKRKPNVIFPKRPWYRLRQRRPRLTLPRHCLPLWRQNHTRQERLEESGFELPSYNETAVVLLVRDPYWIYAYWDFREELKAELSQTFAGWEKVPLTLRVYNLSRRQPGTGEPEFFDISINHLANNWYINVGELAQEYQVDLGYYTLTENFTPLPGPTKSPPRATVCPR